jgi:hypothetical protein
MRRHYLADTQAANRSISSLSPRLRSDRAKTDGRAIHCRHCDGETCARARVEAIVVAAGAARLRSPGPARTNDRLRGGAIVGVGDAIEVLRRQSARPALVGDTADAIVGGTGRGIPDWALLSKSGKARRPADQDERFPGGSVVASGLLLQATAPPAPGDLALARPLSRPPVLRERFLRLRSSPSRRCWPTCALCLSPKRPAATCWERLATLLARAIAGWALGDGWVAAIGAVSGLGDICFRFSVQRRALV